MKPDNSNRKFFVGQEVVCVNPMYWPKEWKGRTGQVLSVQTNSCGCVGVQVSGFNEGGKACSCVRQIHFKNGIYLASGMFAPVEKRKAEIDEEVFNAYEVIEERVADVKVKETVNN